MWLNIVCLNFIFLFLIGPKIWMDLHKTSYMLSFLLIWEKSRAFKSILLFSLFTHVSRFTDRKMKA